MSDLLQAFQHPGHDAKGMFRCWFPDAGANLDRVAHQVKSVHDAGFGGMEIAMVPQYVDFDPRQYGWATPRWKEILRTILKTADSFSEPFRIDLTITAHWPPALNTIDPNHPAAQKELSYTITKITETGTMELPMPKTRTCDDDAGDAAHFIFTDTFLAAVAGAIAGRRGDKYILSDLRDVSGHVRTLDKTTPAGIAPDETRYGAKPKLADTQHYYAIDLDAAAIPPTAGSTWEIGDTLLFAYYTRGTGQTLSGRSMEMFHLQLPMADKMYATDYYCREGTDAIIDVWEANILDDAEIRKLMTKNGGAIFEDSIELFCTTIPWTNRFLPEFSQLRGYDITPYLPILQSLKGSPQRFLTGKGIEKKLVDDYYTTLNELYLRDHVQRLQDWTHTFGCQYRAQSYGGDVNTSAASCVLDIAEGESLGFGEMREYFRNISGGVHMTGHKFVSDEVLADLMCGYQLDWKQAIGTLNSNWAAGVNRMVIHGMSYEREVSGAYSQWPGWHAFQNAFADPWGERQTYWQDIHPLSDFIARTQGILQGGTAKIDLAIFKGQRAYGWGYTRLMDDGYSYDIISNPHLKLDTAVVRDGILCPDGPGYRALLVVDQEMLPRDSAQILRRMAENGLPLLFVGKLPHMANGANADDAAMEALLKDMLALPAVHHVPDLDAAVSALRDMGISPLCSYHQEKLEPICREFGTERCYFIYNGGNAASVSMTLQGTGVPVQLDPYTGAVIPMAFASDASGVTVTAELGSRDAVLIALHSHAAPVKAKRFFDAIPLTDFDTCIESWGPDPDAAIPTVSKKTTVSFGVQPCGPWDNLPAAPEVLSTLGVDAMCHVSGRGTYRTDFTLPDCTGAVLKLETGQCMVTYGLINGQPMPPVNQRTGLVDLGDLVHPGKNIIELTISTTLINRLRISHPLFDGEGGMPAPPAPDHAEDGAAPMMGNPEDNDYELSSAPMDMPAPHNGPTRYGLLHVELRPYTA